MPVGFFVYPANFCRLAAMSDFTIQAVSVDHAAGVSITRHAHDSGQLSIVLRGTMAVTGEEGLWLAPPGLAVWVPPEVAHDAQYSESSSLIHIHFSQALATQLPSRCGTVVVSDLLRELGREAVRLSGTGGDSATVELIAQLMVLHAQQPRSGPELFVPHGRDRRLLFAIDFLRQHPGANVNLDELAALSHTSSRTLARLFVSETGMTFGRWREHLRVVCAVDRLARGQSITQAALELGYQSASSLTTLFTRLLGAPPRRYMEQMRQRDGEASGRLVA
ncbi:MAG TPA: helix-turn-helix transcriptional regulator [Trinickia sp.]|jgi:AraC-like DNA-binding protein/mannose-6-phosphate isomerase-like protein (cupin superfamily)|uniref:AraC family transcriptional regulator n=1 Tax=Trinickia sp. TaxID=2571163 RepID=UPI002C5F07C2|nr:helix-turn-helix transcriptional regulator [Trinickia sp.]HTI18612.1 helix-turn-helix transcriptional regulator [Trinickia sp.]